MSEDTMTVEQALEIVLQLAEQAVRDDVAQGHTEDRKRNVEAVDVVHDYIVNEIYG